MGFIKQSITKAAEALDAANTHLLAAKRHLAVIEHTEAETLAKHLSKLKICQKRLEKDKTLAS